MIVTSSVFIGPLPEDLERRTLPRSLCPIPLPDGMVVNTIWAKIERINVAYFLAKITETTTPETFDAQALTIPNYKCTDAGHFRYTALAVAAEIGNISLISHIIKIGGEILLHIGNQDGWTPLICAASCKNLENGFLAAKTLLSFGANVNVAATDGATPLWRAAKKGNLKLVKLFLMKGAILDPFYTEVNTLQLIEQERKKLQTVIENVPYFKIFNTLCYKNPVHKKFFLPPSILKLILNYIWEPEFWEPEYECGSN